MYDYLILFNILLTKDNYKMSKNSMGPLIDRQVCLDDRIKTRLWLEIFYEGN